ncbi:isoprenoid synthase domain-containing protein [Lophiotrema nucula]|uniref:Isoprenoid synthase domain-containing protein n=1 Tax=Lophiotrema nucula TaxID=690887 RepID=A0A6A5YMU0_9PLEO|nr:isoprenoid synthase domain-containing protein [Lophiotrema nucula]
MDLAVLGKLDRAEYGDIVSRFLKNINFHVPTSDYDMSIQALAMEHFRSQPGWDPRLKQRAIQMTKPISVGVAMCFESMPKETRLAFGIHASYVLFIDDVARELGSALDEFESRLVAGEPQGSPVLQSLVNFLIDINRTHLSPFAAAMNTKAAIEFISGLIMERDYDGMIRLPVGATKFPAYFRQKTGFTEPYGHFCFPEVMFPAKKYLACFLHLGLPDLNDFINYTNDILSFYKESVLGGERLNYICNVASTRGVSSGDALRLVCRDVEQSVETIRNVLRGHNELLEVVEEFFRGYVAFHLNQPRYMLPSSGAIYFVRDGNGESFKLIDPEMSSKAA